MHLIDPLKWIREMFPEQTKSGASTLIWTFVYLLDFALIYYLSVIFGAPFFNMIPQIRAARIGALVATAFVIWWAETAIYNRIVSSVRKK